MSVRLATRCVLRAVLAVSVGILPSCFTTSLWDVPPHAVEVRTVGLLAGSVSPASSPQLYVPADLVPEPWRAANPNPPLQQWLLVRPQADAQLVIACLLAAAHAPPGAPPTAVDLLDITSPVALRARLRAAPADANGAALEAWCRVEWNTGPPADAFVFKGTVSANRSEPPTMWWRGLLTPFTFAADVVLSPFQLALGTVWPRC